MTSAPAPERPTVLVADDEPDIRELARVLLEMDGFDVVGEAVDGEHAVEQYVELDPPPVPNVVLLDNRMPRLGGLDAAERILQHHPGQIVVLFSAHLDPAVTTRARELGVRACVSKVDTAKLPRILRDLLDG
ncbi:response regulator transcription factor [Nocardioides marmoribigeumensis]|jgi:CheY-like chemotaxis protein|uniref:CheY-like chemotaxis protein n=1 Tax=Nocardioides marmoribigeumensis TaxID=433649 RepID=A0ABU2BVL1_9ACTN|nr:response regulator transcription factor [Nocardioides marmoribigeumensis]MDR7362672.1 CheY-like chemotaxis protein [Nocardioides marmoribigeumensis]